MKDFVLNDAGPFASNPKRDDLKIFDQFLKLKRIGLNKEN